VTNDLGMSAQQSFKHGLPARYGESGSVRPDLSSPSSNIYLDVKNYDLAMPGNRANLYNAIAEQARSRAANLPSGSFQGIIVDIRGQAVDPAVLLRIPINIETATGGIIPRSNVVFRTISGYLIP